jgi:hypothetical protein
MIRSEDDTDDDVPISELMHEKSKRAYYFLDARKIQTKFWMNCISAETGGPMPVSTTKPCWWCRTTFTTRPIGCPLLYSVATGIEKERFEKHLTLNNWSNRLRTDEEGEGREGLDHRHQNDFFEVEGVFCSFCCCKSYVLDQRSNPKYKESLALLGQLFQFYHGVAPDFPRAPSWKLLKEFGGHLTVKEFRATFGKIEYTETTNACRPYMFCSAQYVAGRRFRKTN